MAYCMPRISCLPPAPLSPDWGSNTPILTTLPPSEPPLVLPSELLPLPELPPQAAKLRTMATASSRAKRFFILFILLELTEWKSIPRLRNILCGFYLFCKINNTQKEEGDFSAGSLSCPYYTGFMSASKRQMRRWSKNGPMGVHDTKTRVFVILMKPLNGDAFFCALAFAAGEHRKNPPPVRRAQAARLNAAYSLEGASSPKTARKASRSMVSFSKRYLATVSSCSRCWRRMDSQRS